MRQSETLTPEEAAKLLKLSLDTVRRQLRKGELPGRKIGRSWRILRSDLEGHLRGGQANGNDRPTADELADADRAWQDFLAGRDPGETLKQVQRELLGQGRG